MNEAEPKRAATAPALSGEAAELASLREHLERYRAVTLQTLEWTPDDKLAWSPGARQRTIAEIYQHIASVEDFYAHGLLAGDWDMERARKPGPWDRARILSELTGSRKYLLDQLAQLDPARINQKIEVPQVPVPWTLRDWLWYVLEHEIHHKAQLALYLRQLGITPPFFAMAFPKGHRPDGG